MKAYIPFRRNQIKSTSELKNTVFIEQDKQEFMVLRMLILSHSGHKVELSADSMIIIKNASEKDYFMLANEDLKIEFDGECLYIHSPASKKHENVVFYLLQKLKSFLKEKPLVGEALGSKFALKLPNGKRPEPDVVVVPSGVVEDDDSVYEGIPDLIIEILSPSTRDYDLIEKRSWYKESKVPEMWFIDLKNQEVILEYLKNDDTYIQEKKKDGEISSRVLSDFSIPLDGIFKA